MTPMLLLVSLAQLLALTAARAHGDFRTRPRGTLRALWNLNEMSECRLDYTALVYNNYGCWCGVGGAHTPMDGIDECCKEHDKCYDEAIAEKACANVPIEYMENYSWLCSRKDGNSTSSSSNSSSLVDNSSRKALAASAGTGEPVCEETQNKCKSFLCHCDKAVVDCWARFRKPAGKVKCTHVDSTPEDSSAIKTLFDALLPSNNF